MSEPWKCEGCGWTNIGHVHECDGCGERQATAVLDRASLLARVEAAEQALSTARKGELALVDEVERLKDASETMREALLMPGEPLCPRCGRKLSQIRHSLTGVCDRHGIQHAASARAALACPPQQTPAWPGAGADERDYSGETP